VRGLGRLELVLYRKYDRPLKPTPRDRCQSIEEMARDIGARLKSKAAQLRLPEPMLVLEPGRVVSSEAQVLLLRVHALKPGNGLHVAITDGGRFNTNFPLEHEAHQVFVATKLDHPRDTDYFVLGRVSSHGDWVFRNTRLPRLEVGDVLAIMDAGAYFTQFSTNFCYPRAAVVGVSGSRVRILRERESFEHLTAMDHIE
jgi:diaminopimelate decarboxylase